MKRQQFEIVPITRPAQLPLRRSFSQLWPHVFWLIIYIAF